MSIQIYNDGLAGASGLGRTQDVSRATTGGITPASVPGSGEDQVSISSVSSTLSANSADRASRVAELAAAYQSGNYQVNPTDVSRAMVNQALQNGGMESE